MAGSLALVLGAGWAVLRAWGNAGVFPDLTNGYFLRDVILPQMIEWMTRGLFLGSGFGVGLAVLVRGRELEALSLWHAVRIGAGAGAALWISTLVIRVVGTPLSLMAAAAGTLPWLAAFSVLGAGVSATFLQTAKAAQRKALSTPSPELLRDESQAIGAAS